MAKLEEWSLPKPEFHISNPVITKVIRIIIHCLPKLGDENKEIEAENGPFSTITCTKHENMLSIGGRDASQSKPVKLETSHTMIITLNISIFLVPVELSLK